MVAALTPEGVRYAGAALPWIAGPSKSFGGAQAVRDVSFNIDAGAAGVEARILVLHEPTASLPQRDVETLLHVLRSLRARGAGTVYVSQRLDEVFPVRDARPDSLSESIVGRRPDSIVVRSDPPSHHPVLVCDGSTCSGPSLLSFAVGRGERVAWVGLQGAGQETTGRGLIGAAVHGRQRESRGAGRRRPVSWRRDPKRPRPRLRNPACRECVAAATHQPRRNEW